MGLFSCKGVCRYVLKCTGRISSSSSQRVFDDQSTVSLQALHMKDISVRRCPFNNTVESEGKWESSTGHPIYLHLERDLEIDQR